MSPHVSNRLLDALPDQERRTLLSNLHLITIPAQSTLFRPSEVPRYVYLLTSGLASITTELTRQSGIEVGLVGREGIPGSFRLLSGRAGNTQCVMLEAGTGFRIEFGRFEQAMRELPGLRRRVLQHVQHEAFILEQLAACNCVHEATPRLARWLLMATDRCDHRFLSITQTSLAKALGIRRTTVSVLAGDMQKQGLIRYRRGAMQVVDRENLAAVACECYAVTQTSLDDLYNEPGTLAA